MFHYMCVWEGWGWRGSGGQSHRMVSVNTTSEEEGLLNPNQTEVSLLSSPVSCSTQFQARSADRSFRCNANAICSQNSRTGCV